MSDTEITDDTGESVQIGKPYYDLQSGEFIVFEVEGDELIERLVLTGDECYSWGVDEFVEECLASEYRAIPEYVVENPDGVLNEVLDSVLSGHLDSFAGYEPWEVRFAWNSVEFERVEYGVDIKF